MIFGDFFNSLTLYSFTWLFTEKQFKKYTKYIVCYYKTQAKYFMDYNDDEIDDNIEHIDIRVKCRICD